MTKLPLMRRLIVCLALILAMAAIPVFAMGLLHRVDNGVIYPHTTGRDGEKRRRLMLPINQEDEEFGLPAITIGDRCREAIYIAVDPKTNNLLMRAVFDSGLASTAVLRINTAIFLASLRGLFEFNEEGE